MPPKKESGEGRGMEARMNFNLVNTIKTFIYSMLL